MDTLICTLCAIEKPFNEFYKNKGMPSGYANQCKECVKARSKKREEVLRQNPEWVEKEKARARDKYRRLGYNHKQKEWDKKRPWTKIYVYKNINRDLKRKGLLNDSQTAHHWNYNLLKDVFILNKKVHRKLHRFIRIDEETLCFRTIEGNLLDTRDKHQNYINIIEKL